jgi:hypothetical protein
VGVVVCSRLDWRSLRTANGSGIGAGAGCDDSGEEGDVEQGWKEGAGKCQGTEDEEAGANT